MSNEFSIALDQGAKEAGLMLTIEQKEKLETYRRLLVEGNERVNLTAIVSPKEVAVKHFIDSIMGVLFYDILPGQKIIDVGTGAGFPGIPLKIYQPALRLTLLDALQKRCAFLQAVADGLALQEVSVIHGRAEDKGQEKTYREHYDGAVARAVTRLPVLVELCLPFVKIGGFFLALKGSDGNEEAKEAAKAINTMGGKIIEVKKYHLPVLGDARTLVIIEKVSATPHQYPRRAGMPEKKPIL